MTQLSGLLLKHGYDWAALKQALDLIHIKMKELPILPLVKGKNILYISDRHSGQDSFTHAALTVHFNDSGIFRTMLAKTLWHTVTYIEAE